MTCLCIYFSYRITSGGTFSWVDLKKNLNIDNESDCRNYLKGRQFIGDNGRGLEFDYKGRGYVTYKGRSKTICAGYLKIEKVIPWSEGESGDLDKRKIKIDNDIVGTTSMSFELRKDGTLYEWLNGASGTYYLVR